MLTYLRRKHPCQVRIWSHPCISDLEADIKSNNNKKKKKHMRKHLQQIYAAAMKSNDFSQSLSADEQA